MPQLNRFRAFFLDKFWPESWGSFDPKIAPDELLYRRFSRKAFVNGRLMPAALTFPKISVNRSKYSDSNDALKAGCCEGEAQWQLGIFSFMAGHIPIRVHCVDTNRTFQFQVEHKPRNGCFAHSEVVTLSLPTGVEVDQPTSKVRAIFRAKITQVALIMKRAED